MPPKQLAGRSGSGALRAEREYHISRGQFEGTVRPHEDKYWFAVRDNTRERPTVHGFGVDFQEAVGAVTQLLDLLEENARRALESKQEAVAGLPFDLQTKKVA